MIVYDRLWITLKKKNISQYALIKDYGIDKAQLQRLRKNMVVKTVILNRSWSLCRMRILSKEIFPKCNESLEISLFLIRKYLYSWY